MKNKLVLGLAIASTLLLLIIVGFLLGILRGPGTSPYPPPRAVANPDRIRQSLQPGKTYSTHTKGTLHVRGEDKDWGIKEVVTINYAFEAEIDREIESNDGTTIVELRHFRNLRSLKLETSLEDLRIELGPASNVLLAGLAIAQPESVPIGALIIKTIDGSSLKLLLGSLRLGGVSPERLAGLDQSVKAFAAVDRLSGKSVRLTYVDGKGVVKLEPVQGTMTPVERDFHLASVLVSDSLIFPNTEVKVGDQWTVDGSNFTNLMDPALLAKTSGEVTLERAPEHIVQDIHCTHLKVAGGRLTFMDSNPQVGQIGYFEPTGSLFFSPQDQIIIQGKLRGRAQLERFSKDHLLFEARMRHTPEMEITYSCRITDTGKAK